MTPSAGQPLFSVILATRDRAGLFAVALQSVLDQRFRDFEVIVVNDGSAEPEAEQYRGVLATAPDFVRVLNLVHTDRGHGQSYALNFGADHAHGAYLCFLDDDDQWTDPEHLGRVAGVIGRGAARVDLVLANQQAFQNGVPVQRTVWIEDLSDRLQGAPDASGAYTVTPKQLLACQAHCHLNTTVVSRAFYLELGGLDEGLRYECDRDFYLRAIDRAGMIRFLPRTVARHNIPDPAARSSMTTGLSDLTKRLYQLRVMDKAALFSHRPELRRYAMRQRGYVLERISAAAARMGRADCARYYRREALMAKLNLRWMRISEGIGGKRTGTRLASITRAEA